eukprot:2863-Heterococcus_DN1.PRE.5
MLYGSTPAASAAAAAVAEQSSSSLRHSSAPAVGQSALYTTPQGWANSAANSGVSSCSAIAAGVTSSGGGAVQSPTTGKVQRLQPVPLDADSDASYQQHVIHSPLRQQALSPTRAQHMLAMELPPPARA